MSWRTIKIDDIVEVSDQQEILASMEAGHGLDAPSLQVVGIETFEFQDESATLRMRLVQLEGELYLSVGWNSTNPRVTEFHLMRMADGFTPGTIQDCVKYDQCWIFNPPEDENQIHYPDLEFADEILTGDSIVFERQSLLNGNRSVVDQLNGNDFAMLAQYEASESTPSTNNLAWFFETGGLGPDHKPLPEGGFIRCFFGAQTSDMHLKHLPVSETA